MYPLHRSTSFMNTRMSQLLEPGSTGTVPSPVRFNKSSGIGCQPSQKGDGRWTGQNHHTINFFIFLFSFRHDWTDEPYGQTGLDQTANSTILPSGLVFTTINQTINARTCNVNFAFVPSKLIYCYYSIQYSSQQSASSFSGVKQINDKFCLFISIGHHKTL